MFPPVLPIEIVVTTRASDSHSAFPRELKCPECGRPVTVGADVLPGSDLSPAHLERLAHALCGCYVLSMPSGGLARLLASVLAAGEDAPEDAGSSH